jgi:hypothetical protein
LPAFRPSACRAATAVAVVAVLGVGCHPNPPATADDPAQVADGRTGPGLAGRSPAAHAADGLHPYAGADSPDDPPSLGAPPAGGDDRAGPSTSEVDGAADPEAVAARLLTDRLTAEGLQTVWADTRLLKRTELAATVEVQVAHSPGYGHPTQAGYQLTLTAGPAGWQLERIREVG